MSRMLYILLWRERRGCKIESSYCGDLCYRGRGGCYTCCLVPVCCPECICTCGVRVSSFFALYSLCTVPYWLMKMQNAWKRKQSMWTMLKRQWKISLRQEMMLEFDCKLWKVDVGRNRWGGSKYFNGSTYFNQSMCTYLSNFHVIDEDDLGWMVQWSGLIQAVLTRSLPGGIETWATCTWTKF